MGVVSSPPLKGYPHRGIGSGGPQCLAPHDRAWSELPAVLDKLRVSNGGAGG